MFFSKKDFPMSLSKRSAAILSLVLIFSLTVPACRFLSSESQATAVPTPTVLSLPTPTPGPRTLTVCIGQEPNTLYPFGGPNAAANSILAAVYDGPIDTVG